MAMYPAQQHISFEQYLLLVSNSDRRYEYYDGEVRLMAGGSSNHATIALNFGVALDQALGDDALCRPYVTDKLVRLTPTKTVIPDVNHLYQSGHSARRGFLAFGWRLALPPVWSRTKFSPGEPGYCN